MTGRDRRRARIRELVATYAIDAQSDLVELLRADGIEVTQATVSRDLDALGIGKQRGADGTVAYALPETGSLAQVLRQFVVDVAASGNLAVVRTPPGAAAAVASAIDLHGVPGALATVQGDDTLLVVAREGVDGRDVAAAIERIKAPPRPTPGAARHTGPRPTEPRAEHAGDASQTQPAPVPEESPA